jgi:ribosome-associated toxin RatA of RatAB toxin-antitoxin module
MRRAMFGSALGLLALTALGCAARGAVAGGTSERWSGGRAERSTASAGARPGEKASPAPVDVVDASVRAVAPPSPGEAGKLRAPTREPVAIEDSDLVRGRSTVEVEAPMARVRGAVLDFDHYAEFMPHYSASRVVGGTPDGARDVYMQITALHGALKMWARVEMSRTALEGGGERWSSKFVEGNVRHFHAIWTLRPLGDARTELTLEVFMHPKIPLPDSLINEENLDGAVKGVTAMRNRAEKAHASGRGTTAH